MRFLLAFGLFLGLLDAVVAAESSPYLVRPGDTIGITVWQDPKLDRLVIVAPDGMISFPLVGHIRAAGLTLGAVEIALKNRLQANYKEDLDVTATLATVVKNGATAAIERTIYVTGEVNKPGAFPIKGEITAVQAIALSGGFSAFAAKRRVLIFRQVNGEDHRYRFDYRDFESGRDLTGNIHLRPGDVIVVPEKGLFE